MIRTKAALLSRVAVATAIIVGLFGGYVQAQAQPVVGVDLDPSGNTSTSLGAVGGCRPVATGQQFEVDVFVRDVPLIDGFQATLAYDPAVLRPVEQDVNLFLASASGSNVEDFSKPAPNSPDEYVVAAFDFGQNAAESGSGAVIRVSFEALSQGRSPITVGDVKMAGADGTPVQPADSTGRYQGQVIGGTVAVDLPCQVPTEAAAPEGRSTPTVTPARGPESATAPTASPQSTVVSVQPQSSSKGGLPWVPVVIGLAGAVAVGGVAVVSWRSIVHRRG
jgi:hypothetical protein